MSKESIDLDGDGVIDEDELKLFYAKTKTKMRIAVFSLAGMMVFTGILMTPLISIERVEALKDIISMFYIMAGSVIGTFMGVSAWMSKK